MTDRKRGRETKRGIAKAHELKLLAHTPPTNFAEGEEEGGREHLNHQQKDKRSRAPERTQIKNKIKLTFPTRIHSRPKRKKREPPAPRQKKKKTLFDPKLRSGRRETKSAVAHSNLLRRIRSPTAVDLPKAPFNLKTAPRS